MPPADVYFVRPAFIAAAAACLMFSGVSKSGSPAPKSQTFTPAARNASAACMAAIVADDCMRATFSDIGKDDIAGIGIAEKVFIVGLFFLSYVVRRAPALSLRWCRLIETLLSPSASLRKNNSRRAS